MWAAQSIHFGYRWKIGLGDKARFWEDTWIGTSPLSVQFFDIYSLCNEQNRTVQQIWDGSQLKLTFRRNFNLRLMQQWYELEAMASSIVFDDCSDSLIWQFESNGVYSTTSLYAIINFGGVIPIYIPAVWQLHIPPRVHIFLWLLGHNKLMTRDNLLKRHLNKPEDCVFCSELESIDHLFFNCIVAKQIWQTISSIFNVAVGDSFFSVARFWVANKKHATLNSVCAAALWCLWKTRNILIFNGDPWLNMLQVWRMILYTVKRWKLIFKDNMNLELETFCDKISLILRTPPALEC